MPERPIEHQIEDESRRAFEQRLPRQWVYRKKDSDYGIDGEVEIFTSAGERTGRMFFVQLKATNQEDIGKALSVSLPIKTLVYYGQLPAPVLIVRYHAPSQKVFVKWQHAYLPTSDVPPKDSISFRLSLTDEWGGNTSDSLWQEVEIYGKLRSAQLQLPVHFEINLRTDNVCGKSQDEFLIAIRKNIAAHAQVILIDKPNVGSFLGKVEVWNNRIVVFLGSMPVFTYHLKDSNTATQLLGEFVNDIFVAIGLALWRVGNPHIAAKFISIFCEDSNIIQSSAIAVLAARCLADADRVSEALQLSQRLSQKRDIGFTGELLSFSALILDQPLSAEDKDELIKTLKIRLEEAVKQGNSGNIACASYSLANTLRSQGRFRTAFHYYNLAVKKDKTYLNREYFCGELGALLFEKRRYKASASYYVKAVGLGSEGYKVFLADALMFSGEYQRASTLFKEYLKSSAHDTPNPEEWKLKVSVLDMIIGVSGQSRQNRQTLSARKNIEVGIATNKDKRIYLQESLELDYLCALAWFNMGVQNNQEQKPEEACLCFLAAAVIVPNDVEAWTNAFFLAIPRGPEIMGSIMATAYYYNNMSFVERLYVICNGIPNESERSQIAKELMGMIPKLASMKKQKKKTVFRLINENKQVKEFPL